MHFPWLGRIFHLSMPPKLLELWWLFGFIVGNIVGFVCPIVITLALKIGSPNLVYAMCLGIGFALLQVCSAILFKESLSVWQWGGSRLHRRGSCFFTSPLNGIFAIPLVSRANAIYKVDLGFPTKIMKARGVKELAGHSIWLRC